MIVFFLRIESSTLITVGIGIVVLIIVGYLVFRFFKSTEEKPADLIPVITKVYPDPSHGPITIELHGHASQLKILNMAGEALGSFAVSGGDIHFDLSSLAKGKYFVVAYYGATESNAVQFTLQ